MNERTYKLMSLQEFCLESLNRDRPSDRYCYEDYRLTEYRCDNCDTSMVGDFVYCAVRVDPTYKDRVYISGMVCSEICFNMYMLKWC